MGVRIPYLKLFEAENANITNINQINKNAEAIFPDIKNIWRCYFEERYN